jgi:hypothetical protein
LHTCLWAWQCLASWRWHPSSSPSSLRECCWQPYICCCSAIHCSHFPPRQDLHVYAWVIQAAVGCCMSSIQSQSSVFQCHKSHQCCFTWYLADV